MLIWVTLEVVISCFQKKSKTYSTPASTEEGIKRVPCLLRVGRAKRNAVLEFLCISLTNFRLCLSYYSVMSTINLRGVWLERLALKWSQFNLQCRLEGREEVQKGQLSGRRLWRLNILLFERSRQSPICWTSSGSIVTEKLKAVPLFTPGSTF